MTPMRVLIVGASGFIGQHVAVALARAGHAVVPCGRDEERLRLLFPDRQPIVCNFVKDRAQAWQPRLDGVDAVVNAAGIFTSGKGNGFAEVHAEGPKALFEACAAARIEKVVQVSALGAGVNAATPFLQTKAEADDHLIALAEHFGFRSWTVARPSLVIGRGGQSTALFAALAALPWSPSLGAGQWRVQPIHISDLAEGLRRLLERDGEVPRAMDFVGPAPLTTDELTQLMRRWLGLQPASLLPVSEKSLEALLPMAAAFASGMVSKDSLTMLKQGNTASAAPMADTLAWQPRALDRALADDPATQADLLHARLFFLRPALRLGLAFIWIATAIVSAFLFPIERSVAMVSGLGVTGPAGVALTYAAAAWDGVLGLALLFNKRPALVGVLQLATVAIFTVLATIAVPQAWLEPFGPLTKNVAVVLATLVMIALEAKR